MVIWMIYTWTCTLSQEGDIQKTVWVLRYLSLVHFFSFKRLCQSCLKGKGRNHWKNSFLTTEIPTPQGLDTVWTQTLPNSIYARESNHYYNKFQFPKNGQFAFLLLEMSIIRGLPKKFLCHHFGSKKSWFGRWWSELRQPSNRKDAHKIGGGQYQARFFFSLL